MMAKISTIELEDNSYAITLPLIEVPSTIVSSTPNKGSYSISSGNLEEGQQLLIKFVNGNTASSPTININSSGNIAIVGISPCLPNPLEANSIIETVYDGTNFIIIKIIK